MESVSAGKGAASKRGSEIQVETYAIIPADSAKPQTSHEDGRRRSQKYAMSAPNATAMA